MTTDVAIRSQQTPVSTMDESAVHYVDESAIAACISYGHMPEAHVLEGTLSQCVGSDAPCEKLAHRPDVTD